MRPSCTIILITRSAGELAALKNLDATQQQMFQHAIDAARGDNSTHAISLLVACCQKLDMAHPKNSGIGVIDAAVLKDLAQFKATD